MVENESSSCFLWSWSEDWLEGHEGTLWAGSNVLYPDRDLAYTNECISQKLVNVKKKKKKEISKCLL